MNRIIVCGTRDFNDSNLVYTTLDVVIRDNTNVEIISGMCRGADRIGEEYAKTRNIPLKVFPADWNKYGRAAGPIRNKQMLDYALEESAVVVAFWDGKSRGTANMIRSAKNAGADVRVVYY